MEGWSGGGGGDGSVMVWWSGGDVHGVGSEHCGVVCIVDWWDAVGVDTVVHGMGCGSVGSECMVKW